MRDPLVLTAFGIGGLLLLLAICGAGLLRRLGAGPASARRARAALAGAGALLLAAGVWRSALPTEPAATVASSAPPTPASSPQASSPTGHPAADTPAIAFAAPAATADPTALLAPLATLPADASVDGAAAETTAVNGLPAGQLSETGDSVQIVKMTPAPGTTLKRGVPLTFRLKVAYSLNSADTAVMSIHIAQIRDTPVACNVAAPTLIDAADVPIERGRHLVETTLLWSGDTGAATQGKVFGSGYLSVVPSFWQRSGNGRRRQFTGYESVCLRFES